MLPVKNYIVFEKDSRLLCDESVDKWVKDCVKEKSFEDTIVLVNKGQEDKSKKNVEETHKRQDKNEQSVKNASFCLKMIHMQGSSPAYRKAAGKMFSSDKKLEEVVAAE